MIYKFISNSTVQNKAQLISPQKIKAAISRGKLEFFQQKTPCREAIYEIFQSFCEQLAQDSSLRSKIITHLDRSNCSPAEKDFIIESIRSYLLPKNLQKKWNDAFGIHGNVFPVGTVAHIGSTNTLLGGMDILIDSLLAGNFNIYKFPQPDGGFPGLLLEEILAADYKRSIAHLVAGFWWKGGDVVIEDIVKQEADRIVVWGGAEAILSWKQSLGLNVMMIPHGPKYGVGLITAEGLKKTNLDQLCMNIALDISTWDQRACNSLQGLFLDSKIELELRKLFLHKLGQSLDAASKIINIERAADDWVEIHKARELSYALKSQYSDRNLYVGKGWTLVEFLNWERGLAPGYLHRFLNILTYSSLDQFKCGLRQERGWLQTLGVCATSDELKDFKSDFAKLGFTRICQFGTMTNPDSVEPHDGAYDLRNLTITLSDT